MLLQKNVIAAGQWGLPVFACSDMFKVSIRNVLRFGVLDWRQKLKNWCADDMSEIRDMQQAWVFTVTPSFPPLQGLPTLEHWMVESHHSDGSPNPAERKTMHELPNRLHSNSLLSVLAVFFQEVDVMAQHLHAGNDSLLFWRILLTLMVSL